MLNINYCCGLFTDYISARAHYSRLHSTLVPSVACQTTEVTYSLPSLPSWLDLPCADHHLSIHSLYTRIHVGCARLSVGLCTVHDIIVELRARLYDTKGGSMHCMRHRSRLL